MYQTSTITTTRTVTYTEARVRHVMNKVFDDLVTIAARDFVDINRVMTWCEQVTTVLNFQAADFFEIQLTPPSGKAAAIRYRVVDDGSISEDEISGGQNLWGFPNGTQVSIVIRLRNCAKYADAVAYLKGQGWGFNGTVLQDEGNRDRGYSKDGYGLTRSRVGNWQ